MKRLYAIATLLVPTLILEPMWAVAQENSLNTQPDTGLETHSISPAPLIVDQEETNAPIQQASPPQAPARNLKLDGKFLLWLSNIDAVAGASARAGTVRLRSISDQLQISNLVINDPAFDLDIEIGSATLSNASEPFGSYVVGADKIVLDDVRIRLGETELQTDSMVLTSVFLPGARLSGNGTGQTAQTSFERKRALVSEFVRLVAGSVSVPSLRVQIFSDKDETEILAESIYRGSEISGLKGGKIGSLALKSSETLSPPLEPLIEERFGQVQLSNFNFETVMKLFDGQKTQQVDDTFFSAFSLEDYSLSIGGLELNIDTVQMADVTIADIAGPDEDKLIQIIESKKDLDAISSKELPAFALELISLPTFGALSVKGLKVDALGIQALGFDSLNFNDLSLSGIAVAQLSGFKAVLEEIGAVHLKSAGLSGLKLPKKETLVSVANGANTKSSDLLPILNSLSVSGLSAQMPELNLEGGLEDFSLAVTLDNSGVTTGLGLSVTDLKLPGSLIPRDGTLIGRLGGIMDTIGLDTLQLNQVLSMNFDAASRTLSVTEMKADIAKLGGVSVTANVENIATSPFANPATAASGIRKGKLRAAKVVFTNAGVVEAGFDAQAQKLGTKGDVLRSQVGATLPFLLGVLQNPPFQQQLAKALQAFLPNPESLTVELRPDTSVAIADIERQLRGDPRKLIDMLGTSIVNTSSTPPVDTETPAN